MPFGALPVLEVDDVKIAQSFAIAAYLAKKFGEDESCICIFSQEHCSKYSFLKYPEVGPIV